jgi:hypothetical protein
MTPSLTGSGFGTTPSVTKGSIKFHLAARRAVRSLRWPLGMRVLRKLHKEALSGLVAEMVAFRMIQQEFRIRHAWVADAKFGPHVRGNKKRVQGQGRVARTFGSLRRHHRGDLRRDTLY